MKRKKILAIFLALLLCLGTAATVSASEWAGEDFQFDLPEEFVYEFGPRVSVEDPSWAKAGISSPEDMLKEYSEMSVIADFYTEDKSVNFKIMQKTSSTTESIFNLREMEEGERKDFLENLVQATSDEVTVEKSLLDVGGQPFYRFRVDGENEQYGSAHEIQYGTIVNGHTLAFDTTVTNRDLSAEEEALLEAVVNSVRITSVLEKPEPDYSRAYLGLILLIVLVLAILLPIIILPIRSRFLKKEKARMANRLSEFHQQCGENPDLGKLRFVNSTDCTKEAVHRFSNYHAYIKNLPALIGQALLCILVIALVFAFDSEWWMKLLAVGITVYYGYRMFSMGSNMERVQTKVFGRGVSTTARYTFYEDGFRVSGIQSASLYPYFSISEVRRFDHYLYLYYGPENAYIVDQFGFTQGDFEDFTGFIREKTKKGK